MPSGAPQTVHGLVHVPAQEVTLSTNASVSNTNGDTFWPFDMGLENKEREEEFKRMARDNKLKPPNYGHRCVSFIKKIEGHAQLDGIGIHFVNYSCNGIFTNNAIGRFYSAIA